MTSHLEILLVEDNEDDVIIIQEAFVEARLATVMKRVSDGEEALAYLRREGPYQHVFLPALILLDINMPRKNGFEVLEAVKADSTLRAIPLIMLTMSEREEDITRSFASGACSFIHKPVNLEQFNAVIKTFLLYWTSISRIPTPQE
jgi:CheY-like chemotaxis protein